jgi:ABC-type dipeptide/oligopeptide/nickel transport system permease component
METTLNSIEPLIERAEKYGKTTFQLLKLKSLQQTSSVTSSLISRLFFVIILSLFAFALTTAVALWLGDLLGHNYYGFFIVAGLYGISGIVLYFIHPFVKKRINNSIITQLLN